MPRTKPWRPEKRLGTTVLYHTQISTVGGNWNWWVIKRKRHLDLLSDRERELTVKKWRSLRHVNVTAPATLTLLAGWRSLRWWWWWWCDVWYLYSAHVDIPLNEWRTAVDKYTHFAFYLPGCRHYHNSRKNFLVFLVQPVTFSIMRSFPSFLDFSFPGGLTDWLSDCLVARTFFLSSVPFCSRRAGGQLVFSETYR